MTALDDLLHFDSLAEAEKLTGQSYKDSDGTTWLGLLMHVENNERKEKALRARDDTFYNILWPDFVAVIEDEGFAVGHTELFEGSYGTEEFILAYSERGLITADSFTWSGRQRKLNSAKLYFNLEVTDPEFHPYASGKYNRDAYDAGRRVWVGDVDIREGFRHTLRTFGEHGAFVSPWLEDPHLWLLHYGDTNSEAWKSANWQAHSAMAYDLTTKRLSLLPAEAQGMLMPAVA